MKANKLSVSSNLLIYQQFPGNEETIKEIAFMINKIAITCQHAIYV